MAPVFEELLFRGLLFGVLEPFGVPVALLVTALVFALSHFDRRSFVGLFISGLVFAALRAATRGLATPLVAHALANGFGFAMFFFQSRRSKPSKVPDGAREPTRPAEQTPDSEEGRA